tara:strand:+ start:18898 stop:19761 length:864 start_codon:yes stop_codon:yes gene_type:complete
MKASKEQAENSSYAPGEGILRVSKSSFMTMLMCPRQFWWRYVSGLPRPPPSEAMLRGTAIHTVHEVALLKGPEAVLGAAEKEGVEDDPGVGSMVSLIHQIADHLGGLDVVESEVKHEDYETLSTEEGDIEIVWVGMIDGILRHPDGGLILVELKTGNMNMGKLGRTRKELTFYRRMLKNLGYDEITHYLYITPDYEIDSSGTTDKLLLEGTKSGKHVWLGEDSGIAILEPVTVRSINALEKSLSATIASIISQDWPMNWNEYFCPQWCDFSSSCEAELTGLGPEIFS